MGSQKNSVLVHEDFEKWLIRLLEKMTLKKYSTFVNNGILLKSRIPRFSSHIALA